MTIKFPRTYKDLKEADYVWDIEKGGSDGVFIYLKESYLQDVNGKILTDETIAWGENLQEALDNLRYDYWKYTGILKIKSTNEFDAKSSLTVLRQLMRFRGRRLISHRPI